MFALCSHVSSMAWTLKSLKDGGVVMACTLSLFGAAVDAGKQANDLSHQSDFDTFVLQVATTASVLQVATTASTAWIVNAEMGQGLITGDTFPITRQAPGHEFGLVIPTDMSFLSVHP